MAQEEDYGGLVLGQLEFLMFRGGIAQFGERRDLLRGRCLERLELLVEVILQLCRHGS